MNLKALMLRALQRRDDYTCGPGRPCKNQACCGKSGNCGYGPTYCGDGCSSNCDAAAECGEFAKEKGKTCPLNVCCSQYGFCGTTKEFCGDKCQSNCVEHPSPSGGGGGKVLDKVIGYWEAWNDRSPCHKTAASDLPIDALTHVNYAFAYIDPTTYTITTMDASTPLSTFSDVVALKTPKPTLRVYLSIGGWTFSDNNTATQPLFGRIARDPALRTKFASNLLAFLNSYGFDGVDLDWEYPGAPDRGGNPDDGANYVELVKTLRSVFDASGRKLGITFTAPSSYWYLRWFDLPGMVQHVDWINLMTYDLHGVWDANNAIGAIVQGHTNLTEIKAAVELLWRVGVGPGKVVMGFGCNTPGCAFSGGAEKGVCTGTSGYLAYYEIQDILAQQSKKRSTLNVVHDEEAAVKYTSWGNQWISFDDAETFKQKRDWADSQGISGSMIWASDLDDYDNGGHKALTGATKLGKRHLQEQLNLEQVKISADTVLGKGCYVHELVAADLDYRLGAEKCAFHEEMVGYDTAGCKAKKGKRCGKPVCCPVSAGFSDKCRWRGGKGLDCNGQCHAGEVKIAGSSWGGEPSESGTGKCGRGGKALCCEVGVDDPMYVNDGCHWDQGNRQTVTLTSPKRECPTFAETGVAQKYDEKSPQLWTYCCTKSRPIPYKSCHWVGKGDCADNNCARDEIPIELSGRGDSYYFCNWSRKKTLCCHLNEDALTKPLICDEDDICNIVSSDADNCDDEDGLAHDAPDGLYVVDDWADDDGDRDRDRSAASPLGGQRGMTVNLHDFVKSSLRVFPGELRLRTRKYPSGAQLLTGNGASTLGLKGYFMMGAEECARTGIKAEHIQEFNIIPCFIQTAVSGRLPSGALTKAPKLDPSRLWAVWHQAYPEDAGLAPIGVDLSKFNKGWKVATTLNDRIFAILGSDEYRTGMTLLPGDLNLLKRTMFLLQNPMGATFTKELQQAMAHSNEAAAKAIANTMRKTFGVFNYLNHPEVQPHLTASRKLLLQEFQNAEKHLGLQNVASLWVEFEADFYSQMSAIARHNVERKITDIAGYKNPHPGVFNEWPTMLFNTLEGFNNALERDELVAKIEKIVL
ncbi:glycoside hydrolase [Podospora aff. communis PSN243]|uniref:chitinase n=1 Tax=Podospora aff. communis PSN243 TaxID=3040156 RepID=A0AAV9G5M8_9PEZI|nr:glycoside hydrolase [Podospora aff. communis PSN243]